MNIYLIDYENVYGAGLTGLEKLTANDKIVIFYSNPAIAPLSFSAHLFIANRHPDIEFIDIIKSGPNYLDFQLCSYLGYLITRNNSAAFFIVSKDTGFDSVITFWHKKKPDVKIKRTENIAMSVLPTPPTVLTPPTANPPAPSKTTAAKKKATSKTLDTKYKTTIRTLLAPQKISGGNYTHIHQMFMTLKTTKEFHNALIKEYAEKGNVLYKLLLSEFQKYRKEHP